MSVRILMHQKIGLNMINHKKKPHLAQTKKIEKPIWCPISHMLWILGIEEVSMLALIFRIRFRMMVCQINTTIIITINLFNLITTINLIKSIISILLLAYKLIIISKITIIFLVYQLIKPIREIKWSLTCLKTWKKILKFPSKFPLREKAD